MCDEETWPYVVGFGVYPHSTRDPRDALAWFQDEPRFTGDDFETAHRLLVDPGATLSTGAFEIHSDAEADAIDTLAGEVDKAAGMVRKIGS